MPESPPFRRGQFYETHLYLRCYDYHPCKRCMQCNHYNPHNALCLACEMAKPGGGQCHCTDAQQTAVVDLERNSGRPFFDINMGGGQNVTIDRGSVAFDNENAKLVKQINEE